MVKKDKLFLLFYWFYKVFKHVFTYFLNIIYFLKLLLFCFSWFQSLKLVRTIDKMHLIKKINLDIPLFLVCYIVYHLIVKNNND